MGLIIKVKELIEELQEFPQDYEVYHYDCNGYMVALGEVKIYPYEEEVWL